MLLLALATIDDLGAFYKRDTPYKDGLRVPGDPGLSLKLSGKVYSEKDDLLPNATLEIWQTYAIDIYDTTGNRYRTTLIADPGGGYDLQSAIPGHYLVRVEDYKPLVIQFNIANAPIFEGYPDKNYNRNTVITCCELIRPVAI